MQSLSIFQGAKIREETDVKIGFLDSGVGGLSVLRNAQKAIPNADFLYYADCDNAPYGEKTEAEVCGYVFGAVDFLLKNGADAIVIACNTATSVAVAKLRERYDIPIIGMEPAVKRALDLSTEGRILVTGTPITLKGDKLKLLIGELDRSHVVDLLPLPGLVKFAEKYRFNGDDVTDYIRSAFDGFDLENYSFLVLGCTHFNYFKDTLRTVLPEHIRFVDGNDGTVRQIIRRIGGFESEKSSETRYFISGREMTSKEDLARMEVFMSRLDLMYDIN